MNDTHTFVIGYVICFRLNFDWNTRRNDLERPLHEPLHCFFRSKRVGWVCKVDDETWIRTKAFNMVTSHCTMLHTLTLRQSPSSRNLPWQTVGSIIRPTAHRGRTFTFFFQNFTTKVTYIFKVKVQYFETPCTLRVQRRQCGQFGREISKCFQPQPVLSNATVRQSEGSKWVRQTRKTESALSGRPVALWMHVEQKQSLQGSVSFTWSSPRCHEYKCPPHSATAPPPNPNGCVVAATPSTGWSSGGDRRWRWYRECREPPTTDRDGGKWRRTENTFGNWEESGTSISAAATGGRADRR